ncbi:DUF445 domain-containing protein [Altererythrobacter sp. KTW20L]|uniref:DUF445 domain-containing protein n=1 Tax=Altererythrobacter sp. KTW20L TaxID=2942210 RepID=UPI0020BFE0A0|nr:DUF445 domain-containing protein [Altererythrobacter sp. KTW20L]MCL6249888.1 DUF445 domain-containing protein [Altererythrobacter sp. KTW20L]
MSASRADMLPDRARRMRTAATLLLVAMALLFILAHTQREVHPVWGYVRAFAEAGMIGGLADWFAVTALFRHPLGIPIPHTAIIPQNKDRIAETMAGFLRRNFLTPHVVARRLRDMNLARAAGDFLATRREGEMSRIRSGIVQLFVDLLESLDPERLGSQVKAGLARQVDKLEVSPLLGKMLDTAIADRKHLPLMDGMIRWAGLTLEDNEDMVREMIRQRANAVLRWTGLDEKLSTSVLDGLYRLLAEILVNPDHPLRGKVEEGLAKFASDLQSDPALRAKVERAKADLIANPALGEWWIGVWERMRRGLIELARNPDKAMEGQLGSALRELGEKLQSDPVLQLQVNRLARRTAVGIAQRHGEQIVRLVSETVKRWDPQTITDRIENAVGRDLQFIRINGTLVGGLAGITIHALIQLF